MHRVNTILKWLSTAGAGVATVAVMVMATSFVTEVVARYAFNAPLNWSGDIGSYMLCIAGFLALPKITRLRRHVAVTIVVDSLAEHNKKKLTRVLEWATAIVLAVVTWFVLDLCMVQYRQNVLTAMANQIPRWWLTAVIAFGLALSALNFIAPPDASAHGPREV